MFELPTVDGKSSKKANLQERKLRYRYLNQSYKRFNQLKRRRDEDDTLDHEERAVHLRRRWKGMLGESTEDDDSECANSSEDEDPNDEDADGSINRPSEERKYFKKYEKPQQSYEVWNRSISKRVPINKELVTYNDVKSIETYSKKKTYNVLFHLNKHTINKFDNMVDGYDVIDTKTQSNKFDVKYVDLMTNLLHINVHKQNWSVAYKIFALLIRIPTVDIRSIWNLGVEVLSSKQETNPKALDLLEWMSKVYSSRINYIQGINYKLDPVFRSGSKEHTPKYTITLLWKTIGPASEALFETHNTTAIDELIEKISEMILVPPFMEDPEVWFIYAMSHLVKVDYLSQQISTESLANSMRDIRNNQIFEHIRYTQLFLQETINKSQGEFIYPERLVKRQLQQYEQRLYKHTNNIQNNHDSHSDNSDQ